MKNVIIFSLILVAFIALSPILAQDSTLAQNTVELLDKIRGDIKGGVMEVVDQIKAVAPHIYSAMYRQVIVEGYAMLSTVLLPIFFFVFSIRATKKNWNEGGRVGLYVCTGISFVIALVCVIFGMMRIFSPDFYVIQDIIQMIR